MKNPTPKALDVTVRGTAKYEEGELLTLWNHSFRWTSEHQSPERLRSLLWSSDKLANDALDRLDQYLPAGVTQVKCPHGEEGKERDPYALLQKHASDDEVLGQLWREVTEIPDWVDWDQVARGQHVIYQFSGQILFGLFFNSLVGGMGAWRIVEPLVRTGGFSIQVTRRRLLETFQHFLEIVEDVDAVKPGGKGFVSSMRVRLLHATVRRRLMKLEKEKPGYYHTELWGVPINDLHQMGTILAYSATLIWLSLPRQGVELTEQQAEDYLAFVRWIGFVMGTPVDWMATPSQAKAMMESIVHSETAPSRNSQTIANNLITAQCNAPPIYARREFLAAIAYRLNGQELSAALAIEKPPFYYRMLVSIQCFILMCESYSYPWLSEAQKKKRKEKFMKVGYDMITSHKNGGLGEHAKFEFQYLPQFGKMTELAPWSSNGVASKNVGLKVQHVMIILPSLLLGLIAVGSSLYWVHNATNGAEDRIGALWEMGQQELSDWGLWEAPSMSSH